MLLQAPFNAQAVEPNQGGNFQQLPVGKHPVVITASEVKATKDNTGGKVVFDLTVIDGPARGQSGQWTINLYNASDKARSIAEGQFSALCHATGVFMVSDTAALHDKPFVVDVEEQPLTIEQIEKKNQGQSVTPFTQIKRCYDISGNLPGAANQQSAPVQQQPQQHAPNPPPAPAAAWGGGQAAAPAQAWGQQQAAAPAAQAPAPAWQQGGAQQTQKPAWGAKA